MNKGFNEKNGGITLIALVVTIVVLLILAGVSLNAVIGNSGIITRTQEASKETDIAETREQILMELMGIYAGSGDYTNDDVITAVKTVTGQTVNEEDTTVKTAKGNEVDISDLWNATVATSSTWTADYANGTVTNGKDTLNIGDTIAYDPTAGVTDTSLLSYTSPIGTQTTTTAAAKTTVTQGSGYSSAQSFSASSYTGTWRVLGVDDEGQLLIMSNENVLTTSSANYYLSGQTGATYGMDELDNISSIFGHGTGATGARSITVEDINKVTGYNPEYTGINTNTTEITDSTTKAPYYSGSLYQYGNEVTYSWQGTNYPYYSGTNGLTGSLSSSHISYRFNWIDTTTKTGYTSAKSSTATTSAKEEITKLKSTAYYYNPETLTTSSNTSATTVIANGSAAYDMIFNGGSGSKRYYWLASPYVFTETAYARFGLRSVNSDGCVGHSGLYYSNGSFISNSSGVSPVVSLSSSVKLTIDEANTTEDVTYWNIEF